MTRLKRFAADGSDKCHPPRTKYTTVAEVEALLASGKLGPQRRARMRRRLEELQRG